MNDRPVVPAEFSEEVLQGEEVRRGVEEGTDVPYRVSCVYGRGER